MRRTASAAFTVGAFDPLRSLCETAVDRVRSIGENIGIGSRYPIQEITPDSSLEDARRTLSVVTQSLYCNLARHGMLRSGLFRNGDDALNISLGKSPIKAIRLGECGPMAYGAIYELLKSEEYKRGEFGIVDFRALPSIFKEPLLVRGSSTSPDTLDHQAVVVTPKDHKLEPLVMDPFFGIVAPRNKDIFGYSYFTNKTVLKSMSQSTGLSIPVAASIMEEVKNQYSAKELNPKFATAERVEAWDRIVEESSNEMEEMEVIKMAMALVKSDKDDLEIIAKLMSGMNRLRMTLSAGNASLPTQFTKGVDDIPFKGVAPSSSTVVRATGSAQGPQSKSR